MSTRSLVGLVQPNGQVVGIYVHYDGYLQGRGETLLKHYRHAEDVEALICHGNVSVIDEDGLPQYATGPSHEQYDRIKGEYEMDMPVHGVSLQDFYQRAAREQDPGAGRHIYLFLPGRGYRATLKEQDRDGIWLHCSGSLWEREDDDDPRPPTKYADMDVLTPELIELERAQWAAGEAGGEPTARRVVEQADEAERWADSLRTATVYTNGKTRHDLVIG